MNESTRDENGTPRVTELGGRRHFTLFALLATVNLYCATAQVPVKKENVGHFLV